MVSFSRVGALVQRQVHQAGEVVVQRVHRTDDVVDAVVHVSEPAVALAPLRCVAAHLGHVEAQSMHLAPPPENVASRPCPDRSCPQVGQTGHPSRQPTPKNPSAALRQISTGSREAVASRLGLSAMSGVNSSSREPADPHRALAGEAGVRHGGGATGLRDVSLLVGALGRALRALDDQPLYRTGSRQVAVCAHAVAHDHPSVDGNKRTGWLAPRMWLAGDGST